MLYGTSNQRHDKKGSGFSMDQKPVAVVLGGTVPHGEVIKELKQRGYKTILIDYFQVPPAAKYADVHIQESAMDEERVFEISAQNHANLVLSPCLDQQINVAMKVSEKLGLPHPFSSETAKLVTDKEWMKQIMMESGIPTARYILADKETDLSGIDLRYPLIVKPDDSCGSAGVSRVEKPEQLQEAISTAVVYGKRGKAIVEEFLTGTEMSVHGYVRDGKFHLLFGTCKIVRFINGIMQQLCNLYLPDMKPALRAQLETIAGQIVDAFRLPDDTPLFMQTIVREGKAYVIEFSPRCAGGISTIVSDRYAGFNLIGCSIDSYLHVKKAEVNGTHRLHKYVCCFLLYCGEGVFSHVEGAKELLKENVAEDVIILKTTGDRINLEKPSSSNALKYIITGDTWEECLSKMKEADEKTDIIGADGQSLRINKSPLTKEIIWEKLVALV